MKLPWVMTDLEPLATQLIVDSYDNHVRLTVFYGAERVSVVAFTKEQASQLCEAIAEAAK